MTTRIFHRRGGRTRSAAREVIGAFFAAELLAPSEHLWLISPCMRNFGIFDNRRGGYAALLPGAPWRELRLLDVLRELLIRDAMVTVVTRPAPDDGGVPLALHDIAVDTDSLSRVRTITSAQLRAQGFFGDGSAIIGSMAFSGEGLQACADIVELTTEPETVARMLVDLATAYPAGEEGEGR